MSKPRRFGCDLDWTLADTAEGILAALAATSPDIDLVAARGRLGIEIERELSHHFAPDKVAGKTDTFRRHMADFGVAMASPMPGARLAAATIHAAEYELVVITNKRSDLARQTLAAIGIHADKVIGGLRNDQKGEAITESGVTAYMGDHENDMRQARLAGCVAIGVATGNHTPEQLYDAGADHVLTSLNYFPRLFWQGAAA